MRLIPSTCGGLANGVDKSDTLKPLLISEFNFTNEVMQMCDERAHDEACPLRDIGADSIDNGSCEVGIEAVLRVGTILVFRR